jgi:hypothetical protein
MKGIELEALLLGARPLSEGEYGSVTVRIMQDIASRERMTTHIRKQKSDKGVFTRLRALHGVGLVLAIIIATVFAVGVVYASAQLVPDIVRVFNKKQTNSGRIQYDAPSFARCYQNGDRTLDKFEVSPAAHLSDEEVEKILTAKCELMQVDSFIKSKWPTYGDHTVWKDGDHIYYTRADVLGEVQSIHKQQLVLSNGPAGSITYQAFNHQPIQAYAQGRLVSTSIVKPKDYVFSVVRVSEVYHAPEAIRGPQGNTIMQNKPPAVPLGLVAVIKMSLPEKYYTGLQEYVQPVVACTGNPSEHCPGSLSGVMIDVFPRGEALVNPYARPDSLDLQTYEINGIVTALTSQKMTIKASSGNPYTLALNHPVIDDYNTNVSPVYPYPAETTHVRIGSWMEVLYRQKPTEDHTQITVPDLRLMQIITGLQPKVVPEGQ